MLHDDSHRTGTDDSPVCECGSERESAEYFLLRCIRFQDARNKLKHTVNEIFDLSTRKRRLQLSENLLLAPMSIGVTRNGDNDIKAELYFWNRSQALVLLSHWLIFVIIQASFLVYWDLFLQGCYTEQKFSHEFYTLCFITLSSYLVGKWRRTRQRRRIFLLICINWNSLFYAEGRLFTFVKFEQFSYGL